MDFILLYESVVKADSDRAIKVYCHKIIKNTKSFLKSKHEKSSWEEKKANYKNLAVRENGLNKFDLMSAYNSKHLEQFKERAMELQKEFVKMIEGNGGNIESYNTVEEFIRRN